MSTNAFIEKLDALCPLSDRDRDFLLTVCGDFRSVQRHDVFIKKGSLPTGEVILLDGVACKFVEPERGYRQISALVVPGDACASFGSEFALDHSVGALTDVIICEISRPASTELLSRPAIMRGLKMANAIDEATLRAWLFNIGKRRAHERIVHLFVELHQRLARVGRVQPNGFRIPLSQAECADILGLSLVHFNKSLKKLRADGDLIWRSGDVSFSDVGVIANSYKVDLSYLNPS